MDNKYYNSVIAEMKPFLDEQNFKECDNGEFVNDKKAVKIEYNTEKQMYVLSAADIENGSHGDFAELSSWLFDDTQNEKDAESVGIDFTDTLRKNMGVKVSYKTDVNSVDLPAADKNGVLGIAGFTKKMLDVFPAYKDDYKAHVAKYGNFLYMDFFSFTLIPQIRTTLDTANKKQTKKLFDLLENGYINGDRETVNIIVACVAAAASENEKIYTSAMDMLGANTHFKSSVEAFVPVIKKKSKIKNALIKQ